MAKIVKEEKETYNPKENVFNITVKKSCSQKITRQVAQYEPYDSFYANEISLESDFVKPEDLKDVKAFMNKSTEDYITSEVERSKIKMYNDHRTLEETTIISW